MAYSIFTEACRLLYERGSLIHVNGVSWAAENLVQCTQYIAYISRAPVSDDTMIFLHTTATWLSFVAECNAQDLTPIAPHLHQLAYQIFEMLVTHSSSIKPLVSYDWSLMRRFANAAGECLAELMELTARIPLSVVPPGALWIANNLTQTLKMLSNIANKVAMDIHTMLTSAMNTPFSSIEDAVSVCSVLRRTFIAVLTSGRCCSVEAMLCLVNVGMCGRYIESGPTTDQLTLMRAASGEGTKNMLKYVTTANILDEDGALAEGWAAISESIAEDGVHVDDGMAKLAAKAAVSAAMQMATTLVAALAVDPTGHGDALMRFEDVSDAYARLFVRTAEVAGIGVVAGAFHELVNANCQGNEDVLRGCAAAFACTRALSEALDSPSVVATSSHCALSANSVIAIIGKSLAFVPFLEGCQPVAQSMAMSLLSCVERGGAFAALASTDSGLINFCGSMIASNATVSLASATGLRAAMRSALALALHLPPITPENAATSTAHRHLLMAQIRDSIASRISPPVEGAASQSPSMIRLYAKHDLTSLAALYALGRSIRGEAMSPLDPVATYQPLLRVVSDALAPAVVALRQHHNASDAGFSSVISLSRISAVAQLALRGPWFVDVDPEVGYSGNGDAHEKAFVLSWHILCVGSAYALTQCWESLFLVAQNPHGHQKAAPHAHYANPAWCRMLNPALAAATASCLRACTWTSSARAALESLSAEDAQKAEKVHEMLQAYGMSGAMQCWYSSPCYCDCLSASVDALENSASAWSEERRSKWHATTMSAYVAVLDIAAWHASSATSWQEKEGELLPDCWMDWGTERSVLGTPQISMTGSLSESLPPILDASTRLARYLSFDWRAATLHRSTISLLDEQAAVVATSTLKIVCALLSKYGDYAVCGAAALAGGGDGAEARLASYERRAKSAVGAARAWLEVCECAVLASELGKCEQLPPAASAVLTCLKDLLMASLRAAATSTHASRAGEAASLSARCAALRGVASQARMTRELSDTTAMRNNLFVDSIREVLGTSAVSDAWVSAATKAADDAAGAAAAQLAHSRARCGGDVTPPKPSAAPEHTPGGRELRMLAKKGCIVL
ncbi:hypothetical protein PPROV_000273100 [Pycnococcus provasolii]|uniref:Uncharacterized protein n=2 Tax=Pycnococcus provasolii TaxID=41880 RepID=A0A830HFS8_9CHLO|nr:hypothetical protein PPROV_000273100 [Pycnococcus provasolii]